LEGRQLSPQCARFNGFDRNAADASEHAIHVRGEEHFPLPSEAVEYDIHSVKSRSINK
jgi:hypothetical protein